jgi:hypothetical protein
MNKDQSGFIAVSSILVISLLLLSVVLALSLKNYFNSQAVLSRELKAQSINAASACVDIARAAIAEGGNYASGNSHIYLGLVGECIITSVLPQAGFPKIIFAQGRYPPNKPRQAVTNLKVTIDINNKIISWKEVE